jgi:PST family polysaccharide transporter
LDYADLKRKSVRGGKVTFVSQGATAALTLVSTIILARLLAPEDYGVLAMVLAVTAFAGLFRDLGLSAAAVQKRTLSRAEQSNLFWINVGCGAVLTLGLAAAAPLVARFYGRPDVLGVTLVLSFTFVIASLGTQSGAALTRRMQFGRQATAMISGGLVNLLVAVILALQEQGYWALVWGRLSGQLVTSVALLALSSFRPTWPDRAVKMRALLRFGANVAAFDFINYFHRNLDNVLIGRFCGTDALGLYNRAYTLLMFPISNVRAPVNAVAFPALSRLQDSPHRFRTYYVRATSLIALLSMPLATFLFVAADPIIELALGAQWLGVSPIFSVLAIAAFIQPVAGFAGSLMLARGQGARYVQVGLCTTAVYVASFAIGLPWGPRGVAISYTLTNYLVLWPWMTWAFRDSPVSFGDFVNACAFPVLASATAGAGMLLVRPWLADAPAALQLVALFGVMAILGTGALFLTRPGRRHVSMVRDFFPAKKPHRPNRRPAPAGLSPAINPAEGGP